MRLPRWERDALAIWRIYRQLCGPKPPSSLLAKLMGDTPDIEDVSRLDADAYAAQRLDRQRRLLRSLLMLARAYGRTDMCIRLTALLESLPGTQSQSRRYGRRQLSAYHDRAA